MSNNGKNKSVAKLFPIFFCFAVMGFIDIIGVATNYVREDFSLSDGVANLLPMLSLIWFLLISIPCAGLMNRIGRKNTVLLSLVIMAAALAIPVFGYGKILIFISFGLLGIGNTIMQVSLNPLLGNIVSDRQLTGSLTFGQFVKSVISFFGPILMGTFALNSGDWRYIFYVYAAATLIALVWLWLTPIEKEQRTESSGSFVSAFSLLKDGFVFMCFFTILMSVGFEICLTTLVPRHFSAVSGMTIEKAGMACSVFYAMKMLGTFVGAILLTKISPSAFLKVTTVGLAASIAAYWASGAIWMLYIFLVLVGLFGANVFSIAFSMAMQHRPERSNDVSALMITGVAGGALLPPLMGALSDAAGFYAGFAVPFAATVAMLLIAFALGRKNQKINQ